jgi:hypothetical protein
LEIAHGQVRTFVTYADPHAIVGVAFPALQIDKARALQLGGALYQATATFSELDHFEIDAGMNAIGSLDSNPPFKGRYI